MHALRPPQLPFGRHEGGELARILLRPKFFTVLPPFRSGLLDECVELGLAFDQHFLGVPLDRLAGALGECAEKNHFSKGVPSNQTVIQVPGLHP